MTALRIRHVNISEARLSSAVHIAHIRRFRMQVAIPEVHTQPLYQSESYSPVMLREALTDDGDVAGGRAVVDR